MTGGTPGSGDVTMGLLFKTEKNRFENNGLLSRDGSGTEKGRMKNRLIVVKRAVSHFSVPCCFIPEFSGFRHRAAGLPAVA